MNKVFIFNACHCHEFTAWHVYRVYVHITVVTYFFLLSRSSLCRSLYVMHFTYALKEHQKPMKNATLLKLVRVDSYTFHIIITIIFLFHYQACDEIFEVIKIFLKCIWLNTHPGPCLPLRCTKEFRIKEI